MSAAGLVRVEEHRVSSCDPAQENAGGRVTERRRALEIGPEHRIEIAGLGTIDLGPALKDPAGG